MSQAIAIQMLARVKNANDLPIWDPFYRGQCKKEKQSIYEDFAFSMALETRGADSAVRHYRYGCAQIDAAALNSDGYPIALIEAKTALNLDGLSRFIVQTQNFDGLRIIVCGKSQVWYKNDIYLSALDSGIMIYNLNTEHDWEARWVGKTISEAFDSVRSI